MDGSIELEAVSGERMVTVMDLFIVDGWSRTFAFSARENSKAAAADGQQLALPGQARTIRLISEEVSDDPARSHQRPSRAGP